MKAIFAITTKRYLFIVFIFSFYALHAEMYYGRNAKELVFVTLKDSVAAIEVCRIKPVELPRTYLDTLYYLNQSFVKGVSRLVWKDGNLLFLPENILLSPATSDTAYANIRKEGYHKGFAALLALKYAWIGRTNWVEMNRKLDKTTEHVPTNVSNATYYRKIQHNARIFENLIVPNYANSFDRIIITNNTLLSNYRYVDTSDSAVIQQIWNQLCDNQMVNKKFSLWYLIPFPIIYVGLGLVNPVFFFVVPPAVATWVAIMHWAPPIVSHLDIHKTYVIRFYKQNKRVLTVRVKNNTIYYRNHYYALSRDFATLLGSINVASLGR